MKRINCFWMNNPAGNLGDVLTPWLLQNDGVEPIHVKSSESGKLVGIGSVITTVKPGDNVWGSGLMSRSNHANPQATYHCVRGPITLHRVRDCGGSCPDITGDPALLMPKFHTPDKIAVDGRALLPHYIDYQVVKRSWPRAHVINILGDPIRTINEIVRHSFIYSSSLHGLILCHAYGIPCVWVRWGNRLAGDDVKFHDHYQSIGLEAIPFEEVSTEARLHGERDAKNVRLPDLDAIWNARPWIKGE